MKTCVYSIHGFDRPFIEKANKGKHELVFTTAALSSKTVHLAETCEAVALISSDSAAAAVVEELHALGVRYIALRAAGYDQVDLAKAKALGIRVANVPAYSPYAIAEHSVALLMTLNRKMLRSQELMRQNDFRLNELVGFDLHKKTVGVVGTGKIGAAFVRIMHGFGCHVLAYDIAEDPQLVARYGVEYTSLEALCERSDVISLSCPLNEATRYLFNKSTFSRMKKGVFFINTARGAIVNTLDLLWALDEGIVAAAGLDVYEYEKPIFFYDHRASELDDALFEKLRHHPQVLITGHQAFLTNEALGGIAGTTIDNLDQWAEKGQSENEVF